MNSSFLDGLEDEPTPLPAIATLEYHPSLPHDVAMAMSDEEMELVRQKYDYTPETFSYLMERPDFRRELADWQRRFITEGNSFKLKLRAMAEDFLPTMHKIMHSELSAPSVKVDAFKYITRVSGLEPPKDESGGKDSGAKITINIAPWAANQATTIEVGGAGGN